MSELRLGKFMAIAVGLTVIASCYVHQQIEIYKTGYSIQQNKNYLSSLVDDNSKLMYNLSKLESPRNLLRSLDGKEIRFANERTGLEKSYQLAQLDRDGAAPREGFVGRVLDLFATSAEARTRR
ncbi:MAG: hypothetical protein PHT95_00470 [Candidatus Omnitrophica bacterium]|nr:hypothetical protein [Candidatus Omnitrophota bacterium]MDD4012729.1 hypothetical protein [Candidatus Omnitrophota bacterium]